MVQPNTVSFHPFQLQVTSYPEIWLFVFQSYLSTILSSFLGGRVQSYLFSNSLQFLAQISVTVGTQ